MAQADIESVLNEKRVFAPSAEFSQRAHLGTAEYERLSRLADEQPETFWADIAAEL